MYKTIMITALGLFALTACNKVEGPGGTSSITGKVNGKIITSSNGGTAEAEVTTVICSHADGVDGSILDNSDYFLLNTPAGGTNYYVWYENTNWLGQDPNLSGRTGIKVTYSNNESNVTIANNTAAAITTVAGMDFTVTVSNDILTIVNITVGQVVDADDVNTPFVIDVTNQGKGIGEGTTYSIEGPIADERVFLIYGEEDFYSESVRTDAAGNYQFKGLTKGNYRVFAFSIDTLNPSEFLIQKEVSAEITENKQVVSALSLYIVI
jgi:hypothetical protein